MFPRVGRAGARSQTALGRAVHSGRHAGEAWASLKSFKRKAAEPSQPPDYPSNPTTSFRGERRSNASHQSSTDAEAKLARKGSGKQAKLCQSANALMEYRNTILIDFQIEPADGHAQRRVAIAMADERLPGSWRIALDADKGYDTRDFVASCRALKITPHVAQNRARPGGLRARRAPSRSRDQPMDSQVGRGGVWRDEDGGNTAPHSLPRS